MKHLFVIIFIFFVNSSGFAQSKNENNILSGTVLDSITNAPLESVNISLINISDTTFIKGTITDKNGEFKFENISNDNIAIRCNFIGYKQKIILPENSSLTIYMVQNIEELNEISVTAEKPLYKVEANKKIYLIENDPTVQTVTLLDAIQNAPSVNVNFDNSITIRNSGNIGYYINDKPLSFMTKQEIETYLQSIPANSIQSIEVMTNPSAKYKSEYVINIVLKENKKDKTLYNIGLTYSTKPSFFVWNSLTYKKDKIDFYLQGFTSKRVDESNLIMQNVLYDNTDILKTTNFKNFQKTKQFDWNLNTSLKYSINDKNEISLKLGSLSNNYENTNNLITQIIDLNTNKLITDLFSDELYFNYYGYLDFIHKFNDKGQDLKLRLESGNYFADIDQTYKITNTISELISQKKSKQEWNGNSLSFSCDYYNPISDYFEISTGFSVSPYDFYYDKKLTDTLFSLSNSWENVSFLGHEYTQNYNTYDAYADFSGFAGSFDYSFGVYYGVEINEFDIKSIDNSISKKFENFMPSASISYYLNDNHAFSLSYSHDISNPFEELMPVRDYTYDYEITEGNPFLKSENSDNFELNYSYTINTTGNFFIALYDKNSKNSIASVYNPIFDSNLNQLIYIKTYDNADKSQFSGVELSLMLSLFKKLKINIYSNSDYETVSGNFNNSDYEESAFTSNEKLTVSYCFSDYLNIQLQSIYKTASLDFLTITEPVFYTNLSFTGSLWEQRLRYSVKIQDVFNQNHNIYTFTSDDMIVNYNEKRKSRYLSFGIMYAIGNKKIEKTSETESLMNYK
jgi:outer membrane receptor protein involved in Fe transport